MGKINILDKQTANMIAAGEVVDRPSGALKELMENSVDAGARRIDVCIKGGGMQLISVSDDGCGILREDVPKALLRHATSKIICGDDLAGVRTLGFRGEALAAISAVSRMEMITRAEGETCGTRLSSNENGVIMADTGCPSGTTMLIRDLFYNAPARARFMKRDSAESAACAAVAEKLALSHPEIAVSFTSEDEKKFSTPGDGDLFSAIYAVFGAKLAKTLLKCEYSLGGVSVHGFVNSPEFPRGSRSMQTFFVNGRFVRSKTAVAALEEAFRSFIPPGKYPAAVLFIEVDCLSTDVNVHPAKLEIRFTDEKSVFEAVYYCVKNLLTHKEAPKEQTTFVSRAEEKPTHAPTVHEPRFTQPRSNGSVPGYEIFEPSLGNEDVTDLGNGSVTLRSPDADTAPPVQETFTREIPVQETILPQEDKETEIRIIGEAYGIYIIAELADRIMIVDKHAAHERILYEKLASTKRAGSQQLLSGITVTLSRAQVAALADNLKYLEQFGFEIEVFGDDALIVRAVPITLSKLGNIEPMLESFAASLAEGGALPFADKVDRALFTVACKAAVKARQATTEADDKFIVEKLLEDGAIRFCPHGRPVCREIPRQEFEKYFDRQTGKNL